MTLRDAVQKYIDDRDSILAPKTIREYKGYLRNYAQGIMGTRLKDLTESIVQREINREAKRLSPKSIHNIWALLNASIKAINSDMDFRIKLPQKQKKECSIPTQAELQKLFEEVKGKRLEIPVIIAATCGLRRGEIAALNLSKDIDYINNRITVNKAMSNNDESEWVIKGTKTYSGTRTVDAPDWVIAKLKEAKENGYQPMNPAHVTSSFARVCKKLNIDVRFHDLRHYYASVMLSLGVPDKYAMQRMGHATPNMLKNVYQHLIDDKNREVTDTINAFFNQMQHEMQHEISDGDE
jgi:integrase